MRITIDLEMGNSAFFDNPNELDCVLHDLINKVSREIASGIVGIEEVGQYDDNGNTVATAHIERSESDV